jgi:hypothetical protein
MTAPTATVQIPLSLYRQLERAAQAMRRPLEEVLARTLETHMPPPPERWPPDMRAELQAMETWDDDPLWQVARSTVDPAQQAWHSELLEKNREGTLTEAERATLTQLRIAADQLMLRKAYAYALLKWRGHRLPTLPELDAQL